MSDANPVTGKALVQKVLVDFKELKNHDKMLEVSKNMEESNIKMKAEVNLEQEVNAVLFEQVAVEKRKNHQYHESLTNNKRAIEKLKEGQRMWTIIAFSFVGLSMVLALILCACSVCTKRKSEKNAATVCTIDKNFGME